MRRKAIPYYSKAEDKIWFRSATFRITTTIYHKEQSKLPEKKLQKTRAVRTENKYAPQSDSHQDCHYTDNNLCMDDMGIPIKSNRRNLPSLENFYLRQPENTHGLRTISAIFKDL